MANGNGSRGIGWLLRELVDESAALVRGELRLAKLEGAETASIVGRGTAFVALGAVLLAIGLLALVVGVILLVGDQWIPADRYWVAALIIMAGAGAVTLLLAQRGLAELGPSRLAPLETATTLKEDASWVKRRLTSGATSK